MPLDLWIAYTIATMALLASPGPTVMLVVSYALAKGRSTGWATVPGVALGDLIGMTVSLAGAGAVLALSATLFTVMKLAGAAYLIWLGIQLWRAQPILDDAPDIDRKADNQRMFWNSFIVTFLNPKGIVFFIAFVPQFIDPNGPIILQLAILEATFVILGAVNAAIWVYAAGTLQAKFRDPAKLRLVNRIGGGFLIGAGVVTALIRRTA